MTLVNPTKSIMTNTDIYSILSSKPNNPHYLKRYFKFITSCKNYGVEYTEAHHICPKAKDLFPEYESFKKYPWNKVSLTARQHIIAHIILWKAYCGSQSTALDYMLNIQHEGTGYNKRKIPTAISVRYAAKIREECRSNRTGMAPYFKKSGQSLGLLSTSDPRIIEEGLVGGLYGHKMTEDSRESMRRAKDPYRTIALRFLDAETTVLIADLQSYLDQGWTAGLSDVDRTHNKIDRYESLSEQLTGRGFYALPDGTYYDRLYDTDQRILELGLITLPKTYIQSQSSKDNQVKAAQYNQDSLFYNDGKCNKKFKKDPGSPWILGCIDWDRTAQSAGTSAALKDSVTWNDGVKNYRISATDTPKIGWVRGMAPQKVRQYKYIKDGNIILVASGLPIPDGFTRHK